MTKNDQDVRTVLSTVAEFDVCVYQCKKCTDGGDHNIPCTAVITNGDIPNQCLFVGGTAEWIQLR